MGGKSPPAQAPAAEPIKPPAPTPAPEANADAPPGEAATSFATSEAAKQQGDEEKKGLGATTNPAQTRRRRGRDAAAVVNEGAGLGSAAIITG